METSDCVDKMWEGKEGWPWWGLVDRTGSDFPLKVGNAVVCDVVGERNSWKARWATWGVTGDVIERGGLRIAKFGIMGGS